MIAASFLVKHLLVNWQEGRALVYAACWSTAIGGQQRRLAVDCRDWHRRRPLLPHIQSRSCRGKSSIRRGLCAPLGPELVSVPDALIHTPWIMPPEMQTRLGVRIGLDYPAPIVDHHAARERTLAAYRASG